MDLVTLADAKLKHKSIVDSKFIKEMIPLLEKEGELEELPVDQPDFLKLMKSFSIHEKGVAKISQTDIKCLTWHPSNYKLLVAVGDRYGNIGNDILLPLFAIFLDSKSRQFTQVCGILISLMTSIKVFGLSTRSTQCQSTA
jgi:hypothetical protein